MARPTKGPTPSESTLEMALAYASRGWHVFPCYPGAKQPLAAAVPHGLKDATTDTATITRWFTDNPTANVAISCGPSGIVAVDLDVRDGVDGPGAWEEWCKQHGIKSNDTLTSRTPSGGTHLIYHGRCGSSASRIAKGIDTKGDGGYIVAPPSRIGTAEYKWKALVEPALLPTQVQDAVNGRRKVEAAPVVSPLPGASTLLELLTQDKIGLTRKGTLQEWCGPCPFCKDGEDRFIVWSEGGRDGLGHYWCRQCNEKGDSVEWLIRKRGANVVDAKLARGVPVDEKFLPKTYTPPVVETPAPEEEDFWASYRTSAVLYAREVPPPIDWLVYGVVEATTIGLAVGKPGDLKSMLIADMCVCLAAGKPWLGGHPIENPSLPALQTRRIKVAWIDIDMGRHRTHRRMHALTSAHGTTGEGLDIFTFPPIDIADPNAFDMLMKLATQGKYGMIVLDTLINSMPSLISENDNASLARAMTMLRRVSDQTRASIIGIHHPNKAAKNAKDSNSTRGGSAIIGAVDNSLFIERDRSGKKDHLRIVASKERGDAIDDVYAKWHLERDAKDEMIKARFYSVPQFDFGATSGTGRNVDQEILSVLAAADEPLSMPQIYKAVGGNKKHFYEVMQMLQQRKKIILAQDKGTKYKRCFMLKSEKF